MFEEGEPSCRRDCRKYWTLSSAKSELCIKGGWSLVSVAALLRYEIALGQGLERADCSSCSIPGKPGSGNSCTVD
jgi:hypothetical protein